MYRTDPAHAHARAQASARADLALLAALSGLAVVVFALERVLS